jgi:hypothetical protein
VFETIAVAISPPPRGASGTSVLELHAIERRFYLRCKGIATSAGNVVWRLGARHPYARAASDWLKGRLNVTLANILWAVVVILVVLWLLGLLGIFGPNLGDRRIQRPGRAPHRLASADPDLSARGHAARAPFTALLDRGPAPVRFGRR